MALAIIFMVFRNFLEAMLLVMACVKYAVHGAACDIMPAPIVLYDQSHAFY